MYASQAERNSGFNLSPYPLILAAMAARFFLPDVIGDSKIDMNLQNT
jgi:hypothetical protein